VNRIIPSIASANPLILKEEIEKISFLPELHIDIEDGNFIPNITFGMKTVRAITGLWRGKTNAHLFVTRPMDYIEDLAACGVSVVFFHVEAVGYPLELLVKIRSHGMKAGIAFNPRTSFTELEYLLKKADFCLLMSSEPDGEGQVFLPHTLERVRSMRIMAGSEKEIWVDGGIGESEAHSLLRAGANILIMGRYFFEQQNKKELMRRLLPATESCVLRL
jgi:ribulose-phosphate 3-epimerase